MCLILLGIDPSPDLSLVLAANRDEYYTRPTAPMAWWTTGPRILAGRDLEAGGTWMGISRDGRFAALTNYRDMARIKAHAPSRGEIIPDLLTSPLAVPKFMARLDPAADRFNGFNLIAGQGSQIFWYSNMDRRVTQLSPGIHGLSNHLMDTPWPKVDQGRKKLARCLETLSRDDALPPDRDLFALLRDTGRPEDDLLPDTGIGLEWERILSPLFIQSPTYGTRSSTLITVKRDGAVTVTERTYPVDPAGNSGAGSPLEYGDRRFTLPPSPDPG